MYGKLDADEKKNELELFNMLKSMETGQKIWKNFNNDFQAFADIIACGRV